MVHIIFQITYQTVLSTDGSASFAAFIYDDPTAVAAIPGNIQVGFDAGDRIRSSVIFGRGLNVSILEDVNIFRIDGERQLCIHELHQPCQHCRELCHWNRNGSSVWFRFHIHWVFSN